MIDRQTGHLILAPSVCICAGDSLEMVAALVLGESTEVRDLHNGWQWLSTHNVPVGPHYVHFHFRFCQNRLQMVSVGISPERTALVGSWEQWSEGAERDRLKALKQWVREELGREGRFVWGTVTADYDEKSASSGITITDD
ncbi:hypothetical protein ACFP2F_22875 [Hymenobacter artigasi]|uniref:Uncharacterized protein n=1 Tax=Hymenobacter artigasi TaxID=2719616 RepID=A0ABX1HRU4_9BACT|nr:hypothetical protein [Hymenobacter artigasi]NKI92031.1 hypothetical protein [Hymenobacter artigasi]